jgi:rhamnose transport system permease protein
VRRRSPERPAAQGSGAPQFAGDHRRSAVERVLARPELGLLLALAILLTIARIKDPRFLSVGNLQGIADDVAIMVILAVGEALVVITRNVDLSVGAVLGVSAFLTGDIFATHPHANLALVAFLAAALGALCGLINGSIVSRGRVPALVATLGTLYVIRGIDFGWAHGTQINASQLPQSLLGIGTGTIVGLPLLAVFAVSIVGVCAATLRWYRSGRDLYAIGSSPAAARLVGLRVDRRVCAAFTISGAFAGIAGFLWTARFGTVDATAGTGYEFQVIAAVVVGGVAILGGSGSVVGAALGALLLGVISSVLPVLQLSSLWEQPIDGALLLAAIAMDRVFARRVALILRRQKGIRAI